MASKIGFDKIGLGLLALLACVFIGGNEATASNCKPFFAQKQVVHHGYAHNVVAPIVLYQAGRDVELDAIAEKVAQRIEQRLSLRQQQTTPAPAQSVISQKCASCHSGATPKGGIVFDGVTPLDCKHVTAALRAIADDSMPKGKPLSPELKGQIMAELLDLERKE